MKKVTLCIFITLCIGPGLNGQIIKILRNQSDTLRILLKEVKETKKLIEESSKGQVTSVTESSEPIQKDSSDYYKDLNKSLKLKNSNLESDLKSINSEYANYTYKLTDNLIKSSAIIETSTYKLLKDEIDKSQSVGRQQLLLDLDEYKKQSDDLIFVSNLLQNQNISNIDYQRMKSVMSKSPDKSKFTGQEKYYKELKMKYDYFNEIAQSLDKILAENQGISDIKYRKQEFILNFNYQESCKIYPFLKKKMDEGLTSSSTKLNITF